MRTYFTLFSGGDGAGIGLAAAGYTHLGGIEYDPAIAAVAALNGHPLTVADVRTVNPLDYAHGAPTWLHASPVCKSFSQAKTNGEETKADIEMAQAVCRFIRAWLSPIVSIENVWQYRDSASFKAITDCLTECGYSFDYWHLCAADYGVPQTRRRLILVARRGLWYIQRPTATHQEVGDLWSPPWRGWYEAIADLIPTLPESAFAPWQLERLPAHLGETTMLWNMDQTARDVTQRCAGQPVPTVDTGMFRRPSSIPQAFILDCQNAGDPTQERGVTVRHGDAPMYTLSASMDKRPARAFVFGDTSEQRERLTESEQAARPARAFLVPGGNATSFSVRYADEPSRTIGDTERVGNIPRAWLSAGRVVSMTPRALARFMSVPDTYVLPEKNSLACTVLGNMVCPLLMQRIAESIAH